jgi:hypothetical protein
MSDDITRTIVRTTTGTGREVFDTGKVVIGIRAQDNRPPHAANDDETAVQDLVRGFRPAYLPKRSGLRLRTLALLGVAIVAALVALAYKFAAMVPT